jgi:hypothetical protein
VVLEGGDAASVIAAATAPAPTRAALAALLPSLSSAMHRMALLAPVGKMAVVEQQPAAASCTSAATASGSSAG